MAAKQHERTLKMMENFISHHDEGKSINEIAQIYNLSTWTVYNRLGEIAEKAGVTRDSLLTKVIIADHSGRNFTHVKPIDRENFNKTFVQLLEGVDIIYSEINRAIEDIEIMNTLLEEEMK